VYIFIYECIFFKFIGLNTELVSIVDAIFLLLCRGCSEKGGDLVRSRNRTFCMHDHWGNRLCCLVLGCWISSKFKWFQKTVLHVPWNCNM